MFATDRGRTRAGFQLLELLFSIGIFSLIIGICFYTAASGFRIFAQANSRQTLQRDVQAVFTWLRRDVGLSNLVRCQTVNRTVSGHRRDALAVVALDNWQQPLATDTLGQPAWNRVVVYVATQEPKALLLRQLYPPAGSAVLPLQKGDTSGVLNDAISGVVAPADQRRLSGSVRSFEVSLAEDRNTVTFDLILEEATVEGGSGRARTEVLQVQTTIQPRNTWPRL